VAWILNAFLDVAFAEDSFVSDDRRTDEVGVS
jgi:hypothetical protein